VKDNDTSRDDWVDISSDLSDSSDEDWFPDDCFIKVNKIDADHSVLPMLREKLNWYGVIGV
jgi:hypothetical protein